MIKNSFHKGNLRYLIGDATFPVGGGLRYIAQVNNTIGAYGAGFSGALSKKWPNVQSKYRSWWREMRGSLPLGKIQEIMVQSDIRVINMIAQEGIIDDNRNDAPIRLKALRECLKEVGELLSKENGNLHIPRIGCGLAQGKWEDIEPIIIEEVIMRGVNVTVYDLE